MQDLFVDKPGYIEVTTTVSDKDSAQKMADHLIGSKLAACVQVLENVTSTYRWKGSMEKSGGVIVLQKIGGDKAVPGGAAWGGRVDNCAGRIIG